MDLSFSEADQQFRDEVREFLDAHLTEDLRLAAKRTTTVFADKDVAMRWQQILVEKGWAVPQWPVEHGGTGWTITQKFIFSEECAKAGAPGLIPLGLRMLAPVLFRYGTDEQKSHYLPRMLAGEDYWCQGYSEPGAGSDLSSLRCRAVKDGDDYIVNGTKIWTTHAQFADHIFCLVRTDDTVKPQAGITFLLIDMATPGVKVEPIITMANDHEVNQVFFDDVRVPQSNRLGPENEGWTAAKYLLEFERGGGSAAAGLQVAAAKLRQVATEQLVDGEPLIRQPGFARRLNAIDVRIASLEFTEKAGLARLAAGGSPGPESSLMKNTTVELQQGVAELMLEAANYYAMPHANRISMNGYNDPWVGPEFAETVTPRYLNSRAASIFGGSREVQKNIVAKVVLGL